MPKKEFDPKCTVSNVKHAGEMSSVGVVSQPLVSVLWFSSMEISPGNMYHDMLEKNLFESAKKWNLDNKWIFQHDNDPKHRSYVVAHRLVQNGVERLKWPSFSADINPIKHIVG